MTVKNVKIEGNFDFCLLIWRGRGRDGAAPSLAPLVRRVQHYVH